MNRIPIYDCCLLLFRGNTCCWGGNLVCKCSEPFRKIGFFPLDGATNSLAYKKKPWLCEVVITEKKSMQSESCFSSNLHRSYAAVLKENVLTLLMTFSFQTLSSKDRILLRWRRRRRRAGLSKKTGRAAHGARKHPFEISVNRAALMLICSFRS